MSFYAALEDAAAGIMDPENFGQTGLLRTSQADPGLTVTVIVHEDQSVPYQALSDRKIFNDGAMWTVNCRHSQRVVFSGKGQSSHFAMLHLLVSEVTFLAPGYLITVGSDVWEVI